MPTLRDAIDQVSLTEGWRLSHNTGGPFDGLWLIEREDEAGTFDSDDEALEHVVRQARAGSDLHKRALEIHMTLRPEDLATNFNRDIMLSVLTEALKREAETFLCEGDITIEWALVHREGIKGFDQMTDEELQTEIDERDLQEEVDELAQEAECEAQEAEQNERDFQ